MKVKSVVGFGSAGSRVAGAMTVSLLALAASGAGLTSQSYVRDGLVAQFDAIENVGVGQHESSPLNWKDLVGTASLPLQTGAFWGERLLDMQKVPHRIYGMPAFRLDSCTTEVVMNLAEGNPSGYRRIFTVDANQESLYNVYINQGASSAALYINGSGPRPSFGTVTWGTLSVACNTSNCLTYNNPKGYGSGANMSSLGSSVDKDVAACNWTIQGYGGGEIHGRYSAFRHYNRALDQNELAHNTLVDKLRFYSFLYRGSGDTTAWADVVWTKPIQAAAATPAVGFTDYVTIGNATVSVGADDTVELAGLSLEDGASFAIAAGGAVTVRQLFVEGVAVPRGVYTAAEGNGTAAAWVVGAGEVRVTGASATTLPKPVPALGPLNYVQDGLIAQFDAVDNEGTGVHNPSATVWRDLAGVASVTLAGSAAWIDRALATGGSQQSIANMPAFYYDSVFTELAVNILSHKGSYPRLFYHTGGDSAYCVYHQYGSDSSNTQMQFFLGNQSNSRPSFYFSSGTLELGSDTTNIRTYVNGSAASSSGGYKLGHIQAPSATWWLDRSGEVPSHFRSIRHYNRALTQEEISYNRQIDVQRFESYLYSGDGSAVGWGDLAWLKPERGGAGDAPSGTTNEYATVANAVVQVTEADAVALAGLSLEYGATLDVAAGAAVSLKLLYVNGAEVARGVYTADGRNGSVAAAWMTGSGEVRVAGGLDRGVPFIPVADADGWYTYGILNGSTAVSTGVVTIIGEHPIWDDYWFPAGAKLRLRGHVLLDTVPDVFVDYDTSALKCVYVNGTRAYAAERPFELPANATFRFLPGPWQDVGGYTNNVAVGKVSVSQMGQATGDVTFASGANFQCMGDGCPNLTYDGYLSGDGNLYLSSYGRQMRLSGGLSLSGSGTTTWQNGSGVWFDTIALTTALQTVTLSGCGDIHGMTKSYSASYLMLGKNDSDATADHPLNVARLNGNASSRVDGDGFRWRSGGHVLVWGSNTVHVGALHAGLHVVASRADQNCDNGFLNPWNYVSKGIGFLSVDAFNSGTIYGSTNVALTIGSVAANTAFDYTYQSNAVNSLTLDITNGCDTATTLKATDLAMLPARVKGFKGQVTLTETAARSYEMAIDFTVGTNGLYNAVGCDGSGTLVAAPATGSINATFPTTGIEPKPGKYALARFSSGGDLLKNWTVTLNGEAVDEASIDGHSVRLVRNLKGIYLGVDLPGLAVILR